MLVRCQAGGFHKPKMCSHKHSCVVCDSNVVLKTALKGTLFYAHHGTSRAKCTYHVKPTSQEIYQAACRILNTKGVKVVSSCGSCQRSQNITNFRLIKDDTNHTIKVSYDGTKFSVNNIEVCCKESEEIVLQDTSLKKECDSCRTKTKIYHVIESSYYELVECETCLIPYAKMILENGAMSRCASCTWCF